MKRFVLSFLMIIFCCSITLSEENTVYIKGLQPGSPAERLGLLQYDQIVCIDGSPIKTEEDFSNVVDNFSKGNHSISIIRDGKQSDFEFTVNAKDIKTGFGAKAMKVDMEKASEFFDRGLEIVGQARSKEDVNKAIDEFLQAESYAPFLPEIHYNLGFRYMDIEDYEKAEKHLERYLRLAPNAPDITMVSESLGKASYMRKRIEQAKKRMLDPGSWLFAGEEPEREPAIGFIPENMVSTEFKISKEGVLYAKNPGSQSPDKGIQRYLKKQEWLHVNMNGRFFEYAYVSCYGCPNDPELDPSFIAEDLFTERFIGFMDAISEKSTGYYIARIKGEIKIDGNNPMIVQSFYNYTWNKWDWIYYKGLWRSFITDKDAGKRFLDDGKYLKCRVSHIIK